MEISFLWRKKKIILFLRNFSDCKEFYYQKIFQLEKNFVIKKYAIKESQLGKNFAIGKYEW